MTTNKLKRPCAVKIKNLIDKKKAIELQELFLKDGAKLVDDISEVTLTNWNYFGIDWGGDTQVYNSLPSFTEDHDVDDHVTIYTYDEVVSLMSCNDDTAISDTQATKVLPEGDNASESNTDGFKVVCNKTYTITIKGQEFVLTEAEYVELEEAMRLVNE